MSPRATQRRRASGGRARNIVPDLFEVNVNSRFGPDWTVEQAKDRLLKLAGTDAGVEVEFVDEAPRFLVVARAPF